MTNGEKIKALFPDMYQVEQSLEAWDTWWNAEYKEPTTTKNNLGVDCIDRQATLDAIIKRLGIRNESYLLQAERVLYQQIKDMPSVTPQLSAPEVTALAEWTEKLTKECEEAYNKGYADGVKSVNICPHCGEYIGEEE